MTKREEKAKWDLEGKSENEKVTREEFEALFNDNNTDDAVYSVTETID